MQERLQKILSRHGIAARRKAEEFIRAGRVRVNGKVAAIGEKADAATDRIVVDGKELPRVLEKIYYLMYKPVGVETTRGHKGGTYTSVPSVPSIPFFPFVDDLLPPHLRTKVFPIGRLDKDSEGLILFTNDGELKYKLEHPKFDHEKEYEVETAEEIHDGAMRKLEKGVMLDGVKTKKTHITRLGPSAFRIALTEGRNRQIRRMCQKVGSTVVRLRRVRIMNLRDENLQQGKGRLLTGREIAELLEDTA